MFRADRGRKHLNDQERVNIVAFTEAGQTMALISECLDVGAANVPSWQNWFRETARYTGIPLYNEAKGLR
jgi:hypothetical protein